MLRFSQERPKIESYVQKLHDALEEETSSLKEGNVEINLGTVEEMKERLNKMIALYVDDPVLEDLLTLYGALEQAEESYKQKSGGDGVSAIPLRMSMELGKLNESPNLATLFTSSDEEEEEEDWDDYGYEEGDGSQSEDAGKGKRKGKRKRGLPKGKGKHKQVKEAEKEKEKKEEKNDDDDDDDDDDDEDFECPICMDDEEEAYRLVCGHKYCVDCLNHMLTGEINEGRVLSIKCPDPECKKEVDYNDVAAIVDGETLGKYEDFSFVAGLKTLQKNSVTWCPTADCESIMLKIDDKTFGCERCGKELCVQCMQNSHTGTCGDYAKWMKKNVTVHSKQARWVRSHTKPCPNCKTPIEKNQGCHHMYCTNCNTAFSWYMAGRWDQKARAYVLIGAGVVVAIPIVAALAVPGLIVVGGILAAEAYDRRKYSY